MGNHPSHVRWRNENKEHIKEYNRKYSANLRNSRTEHWLLIRARARARQRELSFDLVESDIVIPDRCPVLDIPLFRNSGDNKPGPNSPSLDRIIPEKGYVKGNVIVISHRANILKRDATFQEIEKIYKWLKQLRH